ncbi:MAG: DUF4430 domain-containing protein [Oscillospiraceae bacterium]|nr:DUF4430 domain-containing protein [Oscillospiraceae bacterium]
MKQFSKSIMCLLLVLLLAAAALTGCTQSEPAGTEAPRTEAQTQALTEAPKTEAQTQAQTEAPQTEPVVTEPTPTEAGEGEKLFYFNVTFSDGETSSYAIHTDAETVGEALVSLELIAGEESDYGLYVKTIGNETLDYAENGMYWAFYENGEYAMAGVDATPATDGATYAFVATKG